MTALGCLTDLRPSVQVKPSRRCRRRFCLPLVLGLFALLAACRAELPPSATSAPPGTVAATAPRAPTHAGVPSGTPTATPTRTPTPTAQPALVAGDPWAAPRGTPAVRAGAPCGVAGWFDFPVDAPDAAHAYVVFPFRALYNNLQHAGDDFLLSSGSTLGSAVYSVAPGEVLYAQPLGWGADKGTIVVRHVLTDGSAVQSFYGHLEPDSVVLNAGDCVTGGQQIGRIGRPRTPPHLHFEIRTVFADRPGPGYWSTDPLASGWFPPTQYIWYRRSVSSPGVVWAEPFAEQLQRIAGRLADGTFVLWRDDVLLGVDPRDGQVRWRRPLERPPADVLVAANGEQVYLAGETGVVEALQATAAPGAPARAWTVTLAYSVGSFPALVPLAGGGVAVIAETWSAGEGDTQQWFALSADGRALWQRRAPAQSGWSPRYMFWAVEPGGSTYVDGNTPGSGWTLSESGAEPWRVPLGGRPVLAGRQLWLYSQDGVYQLAPDGGQGRLVYGLPAAWPRQGDAVALPDGGLLVAHADLSDRRLIALNADGSVRWERSYLRILSGDPRLVVAGGRPYLLMEERLTPIARVTLYAVDPDTAELVKLFAGGADLALRSQLAAVDERTLLLNVAGSTLLALDARAAERP